MTCFKAKLGQWLMLKFHIRFLQQNTLILSKRLSWGRHIYVTLI